MSKAPVILFVYNRLDKTKQTLDALNNNVGVEETDLIIYADGAKNIEGREAVMAVRNYIENVFAPISRFRSVKLIKREKNRGLAASIIDGVTEVITQYGTAIVVEDDLLTSVDFLNYMNGALSFYKDMRQIGSISGYTEPIKYLKKYKKDIFITRKGECWGWATWKDRWVTVDWKVSDFESYYRDENRRKAFNSIGGGLDNMLCLQMEGKLDSWAVRWCYHLFSNNMLTVYPRVSKTRNIGMDGSGTHCAPTDRHDVELDNKIRKYKFEMLPVNYRIEREIVRFEMNEKTFTELAINKLKRIIKTGDKTSVR